MAANSYDPINSLTTVVERLENKIDKQDDKIDELSKEMRLLVTNQIEIKTLRESVGRVYARIELLEARIKKVEDTPAEIAKSVANRVLIVFGTALGAWILVKIGIDPQQLKD